MEDKVKIQPGFFLMIALAVLMLPMRWVVAILMGVMVHESFHCLAIRLTGGQVLSLSLGVFGAKIEALPMSYYKEALCALAGPVGSFCLLLISEYFPEAALCGLVQGAYNLLPLYPMDGGRILRCLLPASVCLGVEVFAFVLLTGIGLWFYTYSPELAVILLLSLMMTVLQRKFSCKDGR